MQMNRRFYLISRDKEFSNQFSVHFLINNETNNTAADLAATSVVQSRDLRQPSGQASRHL